MRPGFDRIEDLRDPAALARVMGPVRAVSAEPLATHAAYSGATHERLTLTLAGGATRTLVLKCTELARDFTAFRTLDRIGRETRLAALTRSRVWRAMRSPYLAWARAPGRAAVLMEDLGDRLLPDVRAPLERWQEDTLLAAIARLHAAYWDDRRLGAVTWLARADHLEHLLIESDDGRPGVDRFMHADRVRAGWAALRARAPALVARLHDVAHVRATHARLPRTLVHGDVKVANFALRRGELWAFDWACVAAGPPCQDLGWYLAVNASRLTRSKEAVAARYRVLLEEQLGRALPEARWRALWAGAVHAGARALLWSKTLALETGGDPARAEWQWWIDALREAA